MAMSESMSDSRLAELVVAGEPNSKRGSTDLFPELRLAVNQTPVPGDTDTPSIIPVAAENAAVHEAHAVRISRLVELGLAEFKAGQLVATETGRRVFQQISRAS